MITALLQQHISTLPENPEKKLLQIIWNLQEETQEWRQYGPYPGISVPELRYRTGWTNEKLSTTLLRLLTDPDQGVTITQSGGIAITW